MDGVWMECYWGGNCGERTRRLRMFVSSKRMRERVSRQLQRDKGLCRKCCHWSRGKGKTWRASSDRGKSPVQTQFEHIKFEVLIREFWPRNMEMKRSSLCINALYKINISRCQHQFLFSNCWPLGSWDKLTCNRVQCDSDKVSFHCFYFA